AVRAGRPDDRHQRAPGPVRGAGRRPQPGRCRPPAGPQPPVRRQRRRGQRRARRPGRDPAARGRAPGAQAPAGNRRPPAREGLFGGAVGLREGTRMLVAVTGASGLIGTALTRRLRAEGHEVLRLTRSAPTGPDQAQWDPAAGRLDPDALAKADAVVHLAAKNLGERLRWTPKVKRELLCRRVTCTALVDRAQGRL